MRQEAQIDIGKEPSMRHVQESGTPRLLLTIPEVAKSLKLSRAKVYSLLAGRSPNGIPVIRLGRSVRVSATALKQWVDERQNEYHQKTL